MFNSVSRRYTPPTCTLEVSGRQSALSRWSDRSLIKQVQFQLSFDDPTLPNDRQVRLQGDGAQLEALAEAVSAYVQSFLSQATLPLSGVNGNGATAIAERAALTVLQPVEAAPVSAIDAGVHLRPNGLVSHELHLGKLATAETGEVIRLSAVQLADLADAIDAYRQEATTLPTLERSRWSPRRSWLPIAAGTVLAIGLGTTLLRFVNDVSAPVQTATSEQNSDVASAPATVPTVPTVPTAPLNPTAPPAVTIAPGSQFAPPKPLVLPPPPPPALPGGTVAVPRQAPARPTAPNRSTAPARPQQAAPRSIPPLPSIAVVPRSQPQTQIPTQPLPSDPPAIASAPEAARSAQAPTALSAPAPTQTSTAFDTIPQVAEAREFFASRWQPPEGLTQTLEYRLQIAADGTIARITPLGQAAGNFVDRSQIPLTGEPFVSPLTAGDSAQIRVVLSPDGRVRTFLESVN